MREQLLNNDPLEGERMKTEEDLDRLDEPEDIQDHQRSRLIVFICDALDEFENRNRSTAGCLYAILVSFLLAFVSTIKVNHFSSVPVLEIIFVSTLLMFMTNFHFITNSNILPYIKDEKLNTLAKKTGVSTLLSMVFLVASMQKGVGSVGIFFYLSTWFISFLFETYFKNQVFDPQEIFMALVSWGGLTFALGIPQIILTNPLIIFNNSILMAIIGGICLVYSGENIRQLKDQNIFTITHIISLLIIIFLPLFFPVEGLKSPGFIDWVFFGFVAIILFLFFPMVIRAFSLEKQTLIIHFFSWSIPFYMGFNFLFQGKIPHIFKLAGAGVIIAASLILLSFQNVKIHEGSFYIQREKDDPNRPKNDVEMCLWTNKGVN